MPESDALQWLSPAQTAGKKQPYLFSQGEAILDAHLDPDPGQPRHPADLRARIAVPRGLQAVMSAEQLTPDGANAGRAGRSNSG